MVTVQEQSLLRPFKVNHSFRDPLRRSAMAIAKPAIERMLEFRAMNDIHEGVMTMPGDAHPVDKALKILNIAYDVSDEDLARIPKDGPLIVTANHPFGGLDGLILMSLLSRVRPDVKLMVNYLLQSVVFLRDSTISVDPFGGADAAQRSIGGIKQAIRFIRNGGALGLFPSGEVAHISLSKRHIHEPDWNQTIAGLVKHTKARLLPVFFEGNNSLTFQLLGLLHPRLRTAMLPREILKRKHSRIKLRVGNVIPYEKLSQFTDPEEMTAYVRVRTYILKGRSDNEGNVAERLPTTHKPQRKLAPIIDAVPTADLLRDINSLPDGRIMISSGATDVMVGTADELPNVLREIGRLREVSFRMVGEGTGNSMDLDSFDDYYLHLFAWDRDKQAMVGAYRLGQTDKILPRYGVQGLYTRSLFKFGEPLMKQIDPALEMGRSFVAPDYQNSYSALLLLWKGMGRYIVANPRYRMLFGPVSISNQYQSMSKQLLLKFLELNRHIPQLAKLIRPKKPVRFPPLRWWDPKISGQVVKDVKDVDELIAEIEADRVGIPILLKQYLKLNGKLLGFNVDPEFGDVVDGLILVDVMKMDSRLHKLYFGPKVDTMLEYQRAMAKD